MSYGDFSYVPPSNVTVIAECWGGGGFGRIGGYFDANNRFMGPGGGGGAYSRKAGIHLTAAVSYPVRVGAPGQVANPKESFFLSNVTVLAAPGQNGTASNTPQGGKAADGIGDVKYTGGNGGPYTFPENIARPGGGGGSSATRDGNGVDAVANTGGVVLLGGGNGGDGGHAGPSGGGHDGVAPGGGGGGGGTPANNSDPGSTSGLGSEGAVVLWIDRGVWPPSYPDDFIEAWGTPPAPPVNPFNPKATKRAFMM